MSKEKKINLNIDNVAQLARLSLTKDEKVSLTNDLQKILTYVEKLDTLDTSKIEATSHVLDIENVYREDTVSDTNAAFDVIKALPDSRKDGKFFKVPKVIEES